MAAGQIKIPTNDNPKYGGANTYSPKRGRPMLFQVADPIYQRPLYPVMLALHVNPRSFSEKMQKAKSVVPTYGGFVEFIWPDELDTLSADQTSGAFISPKTGLTAGSATDMNFLGRQGTIAWEKQEDLLELFRCNGAVFNTAGQPILRGRIMCMYDRGIFAGHFTTFQVTESDDKAFTFELNWEFRVEQTIYAFPTSGQSINSFTQPPYDLEEGTGNLKYTQPLDQRFASGVLSGQFDSSTLSPSNGVAGGGGAGTEAAGNPDDVVIPEIPVTESP